MKLITVLNFKGGCGKTFISVVTAELLMIAGKRCAVVDVDAHLNAVDYLRNMDGGNVFPLDVFPMPGKEPDYHLLGGYDFVIVDTPPALLNSDPIRRTIARSDAFIIPLCLQRHTLFGFEKTLELLPEGRPVLPVCSIGPEAKTKGKQELLQLVRSQLGKGDGDLRPAVFLPWFDRVDSNLSARRDFYYGLTEKQYAHFDALRRAVMRLFK